MSYRLEMAKTGAAKCRNPDCFKNNIKIGKGELRLGVLVTVNGHDSFHWRHW